MIPINKRECIPVGCVPSAAVAVPGGCLPAGGGGCLPARRAVCLLEASTCQWGSTCRGGGSVSARERDQEIMGFYIMLCTVHTTQGQGQVHGTIVFYCAHPLFQYWRHWRCRAPGRRSVRGSMTQTRITAVTLS